MTSPIGSTTRELPPLQARFGDFHLDEGNARLSRDGRPIDLQPKAFALLCALVRQPGQLVLKDTLLDTVWGHRHVSESVLKSTISQLRSALTDDARQPRYIETASRRGYRFIAALGSPPAPPVLPQTPAEPEASAGALIGRDAPLGVLRGCLVAAQQGKPQVVLVAGDAGIGKTTLLDHFVDTLASPPAVARGQCIEHYGAGEPYMPVLEALNMLCRGAAGAALVELMRRVAPTWLAQLPWYLGDAGRQQLQREVAGATADRMLREFGELLDRITAERPLLLVLEDLHWSDPPTVHLIGYLARRRSTAALMLLGSFRPTEVIVTEHPLAGLRQELRLHRLCTELDLEDLSEAEVGELLATRLDGQAAPEDFVRALHVHTEGLPLFIVNLLDELIAEGALQRREGAWSFPDAAGFTVPRSMVGVVEKQIARLPQELQEALAAASVAGAEFGHVPLADVLQTSPEDLQRAFDGVAARQHWLRGIGMATLPDGRVAARYAFRHVLYRHVFYQRLGPARRVQWHRRLGAALVAAHGSSSAEIAAELAMHFERGNEPAQAIRQLATVAGRALARSAAREALHAARHGLHLLSQWPGATAQPEIELDLRVIEGVALTRVHVVSQPEVAAAFERTRALCDQVGDSPARARALHGLWWVHFARGQLPQARSLAQRILALAEAGHPAGHDAGLALAGHGAMGMTLAHIGDLRASTHHLEAALQAYEAMAGQLPPGRFVQDPGVEAMGYLALVSWWSGEPARARRLSADAVALASRLRHPISQLIALHLSAVVHYLADEMHEVLRATEHIFELVRTNDLPSQPGGFSWLHGHAVAALGRPDEGLAEMRAAERSCQAMGLQVGLTGFHLHHAEACRDAGQADAARAAIEQGLALAEAGHEHCALSPLYRTRAEMRLERGDLKGAAADLQFARDIAARQGAGFHELRAILVTCRLPGSEQAVPAERLRELLRACEDEHIRPVAEARALLAR